jgi:hypothetical protein
MLRAASDLAETSRVRKLLAEPPPKERAAWERAADVLRSRE